MLPCFFACNLFTLQLSGKPPQHSQVPPPFIPSLRLVVNSPFQESHICSGLMSTLGWAGTIYYLGAWRCAHECTFPEDNRLHNGGGRWKTKTQSAWDSCGSSRASQFCLEAYQRVALPPCAPSSASNVFWTKTDQNWGPMPLVLPWHHHPFHIWNR